MNDEKTDYELVSALANTSDWETYHRLRREELFDAKGRGGIYDANRAEERLSNHFPLLLKFENRGIGTTRLGVRSDRTAVIRLVAIAKNEQGKGHGLELAKRVEQVAREKGTNRLLVNAAPEAVGYYEKLGYVRDDWDPSEKLMSILRTQSKCRRCSNSYCPWSTYTHIYSRMVRPVAFSRSRQVLTSSSNESL